MLGVAPEGGERLTDEGPLRTAVLQSWVARVVTQVTTGCDVRLEILPGGMAWPAPEVLGIAKEWFAHQEQDEDECDL